MTKKSGRNIVLLIGLVFVAVSFNYVMPFGIYEFVEGTIPIKNIRIRDPFVLTDKATKTYYLYASKSNRQDTISPGVEVYTSRDLQNWSEPVSVFEVPRDFWARKWVWAPEVHEYEGKYYLFVTFTSDDKLRTRPFDAVKNWPPFYRRGTQILVADHPEGPFLPFKNAPHTSMDQMTLDGTLWVENGQPFMIYCHEWVEIKDGTVNLVPLTDDLSAVNGPNQVLFSASSALWASGISVNNEGYITDGCYVYRTESGKLLMIWSSFSKSGYSIGMAESESGSIKGPWIHQKDRLFASNGGHGMIFKTFKDELVVALHQPNSYPDERMKLYHLIDKGNTLVLGNELFK